MKKPSELNEGEALTIRSKYVSLGFHRYYGTLSVFALPNNTDPRDLEKSLGFTEDEDQADTIYATHVQNITNRNNGTTPTACEDIEIWFYGENANEMSPSYHAGEKIL